jgi:itaconyl-CoA hydratase
MTAQDTAALNTAARRLRDEPGRDFEDFVIGDVYEHRPGRTITQQDNIWFSLLTMNQHPVHCDEEYGRTTEFGRCIVCSPLTVSVLVGLSVRDVSYRAIANLGWREIRMTAPVFAGDTLYAETEVLDKRRSASRPDAGIVTVRTTGRNQHGKVVCTFERSALVPCRTAAEA